MVRVTEAFSEADGWTVERSVKHTQMIAALGAERYGLNVTASRPLVRRAEGATSWEVVVVLDVLS